MKRFAILLGVCLLTGCRNPAAQELLERDLRLQEDRIYELEALVEKYETILACDEPSAKVIRSDSSSDPAPKPGGVELPPGFDAPAAPLQPPRIERPESNGPSRREPIRSEPLRSDAGERDTEHTEAPRFLPSSRGKSSSSGKSELPRLGPARSGEPWQDGDFEIPVDEEEAKPRTSGRTSARPASLGRGKVEEITLGEQGTRSRNRDGRPGDEGLDVVIEPRDAEGKLLRANGSVSVVVLDPTFSGPQARVARWDFAAKDVTSLASTQSPEKGLLLELDWPGTPPHNRTLNLYVRYLTAEGRELRTEQQIDVAVPGGRRTWQRAAPPARPARPSHDEPRELPRDEEWEDRGEREAHHSAPQRPDREDVAQAPLRVRLPGWTPNR